MTSVSEGGPRRAVLEACTSMFEFTNVGPLLRYVAPHWPFPVPLIDVCPSEPRRNGGKRNDMVSFLITIKTRRIEQPARPIQLDLCLTLEFQPRSIGMRSRIVTRQISLS